MSRRLALALIVLASGCNTEMGSASVPSMIEVADVQPREVEVGDHLEVLGSGFPLKRTAHVLLRGTVHRPGLAAEPVAIAIDAETRSEGRLEIPLSSQITDRIVGTGDAALHATFRGEVVVSFAPAESGTAALTGKATGVVLDVRPERLRTPAIARREEAGRKLLDFLGVTIGAAAPASGGLLVTAVRPASPAANAGIEAQDVIVDFEGVRVASISDLAPSSDLASMGVRRDGDAQIRALTVPLAGFSQRVPRSMVASALLVGIASVLVLLGASKPSAGRAFVERAAADRLRLGARALLRDGLPSLAIVAAVAPLLPIAQTMLGIDLDVGALLCVGGAALLALSLAEERSGTALAIARDQIPAVLGAASVVIATGSLRLDDVLRAQGALPWEWFAFRTPATSLAFAAWLATAAAPKTRRGPTDEAATVVTSVLAAALFLGGWRLPSVVVEKDVWSTWHLVAALTFALKAALVAGIVRSVSAILPVESPQRLHSTWRSRAPLSALALAATAAIASVSPSPSLLRVLGLGTFVACVALGAFAVLRAASSVRKIAVRHVDPAI
ncbi:MAG: PDZ domain-containing protein [Polyangiales bacterium]